jgi:hypothetical protein
LELANRPAPTLSGKTDPLSRFLPPTDASVILFLLLMTLGLSSWSFIFEDPDTAWHLAAGDLIRVRHAIIYTDPWSFTTAGTRWYNLSWLFDVGLSFVVSAWGYSAAFGLTLLGYTGCLAFMAHHCLRRGGGLLATFIVLLLCALLLFPGIIARPQLCSEILTVLFYHHLHRYRASGKTGHLYLLPPLMALWVNLHGGFVLAFPLMGLFLAEAKWKRNHAQVRALGMAMLVCLAATGLNPYGFDVFTGVYRTLFSSFGQTAVQEWQPIKIGRSGPFLILLMILLCTGPLFDGRTPRIEDILTVCLFILTLRSARHVAVLSLLMMPYLSLRLTLRLAAGRWGERIAARESLLLAVMRRRDVQTKAAAIAVCSSIALCLPYPRIALVLAPFIALQIVNVLTLLHGARDVSMLEAVPRPLPTRRSFASLALAVMFYFLYPHNVLFQHITGFPTRLLPIAEANVIATRYPELRFYNDYDIGGYLIYLWRGKIKLFVDGRANSAYSEELLADHVSFRDSGGFGARAEEIVRKYRLDGAIIANANPTIAQWNANPEWTSVFRGAVATIYLRRDRARADTP